MRRSRARPGSKENRRLAASPRKCTGRIPPYLEIFARVAETGEPARFDAPATSTDRVFSVSAVSPRRGYFLTIATDVTDRERTVQSLRRYQLLADPGLDIVLFVRKDDGRILEANTAAALAYGYSREQLCARTIHDLRDAERGITDSQIAAADEGGILFESVHRRKDGSEFPVEVRSRGANLCGVRVLVSLIRDTSERKLAHEALASERARLAVTLHSIGDGVIATDEQARVTLLNEVAERLTGWSAAEASGKPVDEVFRIVDENSRRAAASPVERVLREGSPIGIAPHTTLIARDGIERPIADSGAPIRDEKGKVSGAVLVFRDQTVERKAALALEQSEARYRSLFENLSEAVTIFDAVRGEDGQIIDWIVRKQNKQARVALGPAVGPIEGRRLTEILGPEDALEHIERSREVMRTGIPSTREIRL